jgi:hypothetical protein
MVTIASPTASCAPSTVGRMNRGWDRRVDLFFAALGLVLFGLAFVVR